MICTFPIWFGVGAALLGVITGILGAMIGVLATLFGVLVAAIALPLNLLFGWDSYDTTFDWHPAVWVVLLVTAAFLFRKRK